jgi:hypothetical protein
VWGLPERGRGTQHRACLRHAIDDSSERILISKYFPKQSPNSYQTDTIKFGFSSRLTNILNQISSVIFATPGELIYLQLSIDLSRRFLQTADLALCHPRLPIIPIREMYSYNNPFH